jgi:phytoene dehydrogenase-like protein
VSAGTVIVVGAGLGGLAAALRLRRLGHAVRVLEAGKGPGGLASAFTAAGHRFDGGPYVLLDRPGLAWAFAALGLDLEERLTLKRLEHVYEVEQAGGPTVRVLASREETAEGLERTWPGSGARYLHFVAAMAAHDRRLRPLLYRSPRGARDLLRGGAWRSAPLLLRSLGHVLRDSGLPAPVRDALGIWTHVAAQSLAAAPGVMAFVPALVHEAGAYYPRGGVGAVPEALAAAAAEAGVVFDYGVRVRRIVCGDGRVRGVETADGRRLEAARVVSNAGGLATSLDLTDATPKAAAARLRALPLQSPGVAAYLLARGPLDGAYLRFHLPGGGAPCRLWIRPAAVDRALVRDGWWPARLLAPMAHAAAESGGRAGQEAFLERLLAEPWWRKGLTDTHLAARRLPADWGAAFGLHRDSMNPVMTARFMRAARMPHRSPWVKGLYLAGSATHPGQWVSFCAISGVLAAERLHEDAR